MKTGLSVIGMIIMLVVANNQGASANEMIQAGFYGCAMGWLASFMMGIFKTDQKDEELDTVNEDSIP